MRASVCVVCACWRACAVWVCACACGVCLALPVCLSVCGVHACACGVCCVLCGMCACVHVSAWCVPVRVVFARVVPVWWVYMCGVCLCVLVVSACVAHRGWGESLASDFHPAGKGGTWSPWAGGLQLAGPQGPGRQERGAEGWEAPALALGPSVASARQEWPGVLLGPRGWAWPAPPGFSPNSLAHRAAFPWCLRSPQGRQKEGAVSHRGHESRARWRTHCQQLLP